MTMCDAEDSRARHAQLRRERKENSAQLDGAYFSFPLLEDDADSEDEREELVKQMLPVARSAPSTIHWCIDQPTATVRRDSLVCCGSVEILWYPQFLQFFEFFEFEI